MKIYNPMNIKREDIKDITSNNITVFLAGPCPRGDEGDWRDEFYSLLGDRCKDITFFSPTNPDYKSMGPDAYDIQCNWEREALSNCRYIFFWVARDDKHPALTTNVEFGYWLERRPLSIIYGRPDDALNIKYLDWLFTKHYNDDYFAEAPIHNSLEQVIDILDKLDKGE